MTDDRWADIWEGRTPDPSHGSTLAQLMAADGLDTAYGLVGEEAWSAFALSVAERLQLEPGDSVYEVGCGAGAFLYPLAAAGLRVGGSDRSVSLVNAARQALPEGHFEVADADAFIPDTTYDAVVSCGVFLYFPSDAYAERVITRMCSTATQAVALLDLPDRACAAAARAARERAMGGAAAYAARYAGLEHRAYDREHIAGLLRAEGLVGVRTAGQRIDGYANAQWRFNAWGFRRS